jgi:hypothetical protein
MEEVEVEERLLQRYYRASQHHDYDLGLFGMGHDLISTRLAPASLGCQASATSKTSLQPDFPGDCQIARLKNELQKLLVHLLSTKNCVCGG